MNSLSLSLLRMHSGCGELYPLIRCEKNRHLALSRKEKSVVQNLGFIGKARQEKNRSPDDFPEFRCRVNSGAESSTNEGSEPFLAGKSGQKINFEYIDEEGLSNESPKSSDKKSAKLRRNEKKEGAKVLAAKKFAAFCYGCGAALQTENEELPGFVDTETYAIKKTHRQLSTILCGRCRQLAHGAMIAAVGGNGGYGPEAELFVTAEELREQLSFIRTTKALVVKLVDIVDFNGSFLNRVRDLIGNNPIILVITKIDLLPESTDLEAVGDWVVENLRKKKISVISVHLTSAKAPSGIAGVAGSILRERQGRDVFVMGAANVGKSCFISALMEEMAKRDYLAAAALKKRPIASAMPGTTLGTIPLRVFAGSSCLYDTAGVHLHHRMPAVIQPLDLPKIAPKRRLRGFVPSPSPADNSEKLTPNKGGMQGQTIFWGGLARLDVLQAPPSVTFTVYGGTGVRVSVVESAMADQFYEEQVGKALVPPSPESVPTFWEGLPQNKEFSIEARCGNRPCGDIAISGLGWITVSGVSREDPCNEEGVNPSAMRHTIRVAVHVPRGIAIYQRDPLPVGESGRIWYQFADLSEEEEKSRPKLFFDSQDAHE